MVGYDQPEVIHPITGNPLVTPQSCGDFSRLFPKEEKTLELVRQKVANGERVLIYTSWTRTDSQEKLRKLLRENGYRTEILTPQVATEKREEWVDIIDDAKQREKMTEEFYLAVKKEIAAYQEKCDYLIKSGSQSAAVMDRWVLKVRALEEKKRHYEGVLQRELDGLDDEFSVLKFLSQELQIRANSIRSQRFQQRAA